MTSVSGAKPCFLSSLRISFAAALASRRRCTSRSRTSPSSSTARQSQDRLPAIRTAISSRCQREVGRCRLRRRALVQTAGSGPAMMSAELPEGWAWAS